MQCEGKKWGAYRDVSGRAYPCSRSATIEREGHWWCWQHDPKRVAAEKLRRQAKAEAERARMVFYRGQALPVEVKMPSERHRLTDGEIASIEELRRVGVEPCVATCVEDVVEAFEVLALEEGLDVNTHQRRVAMLAEGARLRRLITNAARVIVDKGGSEPEFDALVDEEKLPPHSGHPNCKCDTNVIFAEDGITEEG